MKNYPEAKYGKHVNRSLKAKKKTAPSPKPFMTLVCGKRVLYCGHNASFVADIRETPDCILVRPNGPLTEDLLTRPAGECEYWLTDFPDPGFWRPDLGIFLVPKSQCEKVKTIDAKHT